MKLLAQSRLRPLTISRDLETGRAQNWHMPKHPRRQEAPLLTHGPADDARKGRFGDRGRSQRRQGVPAPTASARGRALRTTDPRKRVGALINILPDHLAQSNPTATREALDALTALLRSHRRVVARLIKEHGFKVGVRFLASKADPVVNQWRADLWVSEQRTDTAPLSAQRVYQRALELIQETGTTRHALARLIEERGLRVIAQLWESCDKAGVRALFELPARRKRGRPAHSYTRDPFAYAAAITVTHLGVRPAQLLRALGRAPIGPADHSWLNACRRRGNELLEGALSPDPDIPVLTFSLSYYDNRPGALLDALLPYLSDEYKGPRDTGTGNSAAAIEARLRSALESFLPS